MDFTNAINNLDQLKGHIQTPFRYDFQYTSQETGTISTLINFDEDWKIFIIITNTEGNQSVKQLSLLREDNGHTTFNGFWETISYHDVYPIVCDTNHKMTDFWSNYVQHIEKVTSNMLQQLSTQNFNTIVTNANNEQLDRALAIEQKSKKKIDKNTYPWYLRTQTISPARKKIISRTFGYSVYQWLKENGLNLVCTSDPFKSKSIYINDLDRKL